MSFQVPGSKIDTYGVSPVANCAGGIQQQTKQELMPVLFWFLSGADNTKVGLVFCQPIAQAYNVHAYVELASGILRNVTIVDQNLPSNNFTSPPQSGAAFNG